MTTRATVTVTVTLTIKLQQGWGDNCTIGQIRKQADEHGRDIMREVLKTSSAEVLDFDLKGIKIAIPAE